MKLGDYLAAPRPPFDFIANDCCRWVDAWVVARGHDSPMQALGLDYDSETSALRCIAKGGGLAALWTAGMIMVGIGEADEPRIGDVGVIRRATTCGLNEAAALYTGARWVSLGLRGLDFGPADVLRVWRV